MHEPARVLDVYAGAGGLSAGFRTAGGYELAAAVESDPDAVRTYQANHPGVMAVAKDVRTLSGGKLDEIVSGSVDMLVGGPPCQGFSVSGPRDPQHPSTELLFEFARLVEEVRPAAFLIENVPGLLSFRRGTVVDRLVRGLSRLTVGQHRYTVVLDVLDAAAFGVPQHRRRVFICGILGEAYRFPATSSARVTLIEAIGDLPEWTASSPDEVLPLPKAYPLTAYQRARRGTASALYNHSAKRLEERRLERLAFLQEEGHDRRALPDHLQAGGREGKYRKLRSSAPSPTILAHMAHDTSGFIHPRYDRMLTVREAARLQGFDDTYRFEGSQYQQFNQVGNAVPPLLAAELARALALPVRRAMRRRQPAPPPAARRSATA
jgi:DNA (cytosine-5)-methyltransferase 1